jgi:hypothetical protein
MPQISSTYRLSMTAHDMAGALKHPHPDVPFTTLRDDTITALSQFSQFSTIGDAIITAIIILSAILKNKFKTPLSPMIKNSPIKAT